MRALFLAHKELLSLLMLSPHMFCQEKMRGKWEWGESERREGKDERRNRYKKKGKGREKEKALSRAHIRLP